MEKDGDNPTEGQPFPELNEEDAEQIIVLDDKGVFSSFQLSQKFSIYFVISIAFD